MYLPKTSVSENANDVTYLSAFESVTSTVSRSTDFLVFVYSLGLDSIMPTSSPHFTWRKKAWYTRLVLTFLAADSSLAHVHYHRPADAHHHDKSERDLSASAVQDRTCGTPEPTKERMIQDKRLVKTWSDFRNQNKKWAVESVSAT
jgi:hypothetical protein